MNMDDFVLYWHYFINFFLLENKSAVNFCINMRKQHSHEENTNVNSTLAPLVLNVLQACEGRDTAGVTVGVTETWRLQEHWLVLLGCLCLLNINISDRKTQ